MDNNIKYSEEIEKVINQQNTECALYGTEECRFINAESCSECTVGLLAHDKQETVKTALGKLMQAAPQDELEPLYTSEECLLCKGEEKGKAECWALFDLAKREEEGDWTLALGKKRIGVKSADMVLPLQVSCCKKCRAAHRRFDYLPTAVALVIAAAGLILTTNRGFYKAAYDTAPWLPAAVMAAFGILAIAASAVLRRVFAKAAAKRMHIDASGIPGVDKLIEKGFYEVGEKKNGVSAMVFANERREHGVCSRVTEPEEGQGPALCGIWPAEHYQPSEPDGEES